MRPTAVLLLLVACAGIAAAGGNPEVRCYVDFDPPNRVHMISPEPGATVDAFICLDNLDMGMECLNFRLTDVMSEFPGVFSSCSFECLLPGNLMIGDPFTEPGATICSTECMHAPVTVGVVHLEYLVGAACLEVLDNIDYPRWTIDCSPTNPHGVDEYTVGWHGSIGGACCSRGESGVDVRCEPQGSGTPIHPPTYWFDVEPGFLEVLYDFRVRVFDPDPEHYTNWVSPEEWIYGLEQIGSETWAVWHNGGTGLTHGFRFQFDHPNPPVWSHWELQRTFDSVLSVDMPLGADGCGYRVHAPAGASPVESSTWGTVKALYR